MEILYIVLALLGLGFLIFIHELGHYFMAKKVGMKVEAFSIGFGKPIYVWERNGVKWQLCALPFGGYVRIAGMEKKGALEPHQIPEGFYGKKPKERIKVALAGPVVNLVFALFMFTLIWAFGGRNKPFSEFTQYVGWVDPHSKPYVEGIKPGDQLTKVDQEPLEGFTDLLYAAALNGQPLTVEGWDNDYFSGEKKHFRIQLDEGKKKLSLMQRMTEVSALSPANFLLYDKQPNGDPNPIPSGSPMEKSGIQYGDRIVWIDGQLVFSQQQLASLINQPRVLLTVKRDNEVFLSRVPRLHIADLQMSEAEKAELDDWRIEAGVSSKIADVYYIPYVLNQQCQVESTISYVDEFSQHCPSFKSGLPGDCPGVEKSLAPGDQILAVDGKSVANAFDCLRTLQDRQSQIIVLRGDAQKNLSWKDANIAFMANIDWHALQSMTQSIGTAQPISNSGNLHLLQPVTPRPFLDFPQSLSRANWMKTQEKDLEKVEKIKDPEQQAKARKRLEDNQKMLRLGIVLQDQLVSYNPQPFILFGDVVSEVGQTLRALFTGVLTPKAMSGPVGIVQIMHSNWAKGVKEAFFWLGVISLNLGIFNLLPIPVLDGGHICFALWESVTKKPIKSRTMERLVIPFIILLIALLLFTTYNDIMRMIKGFFF